MQILGIDTETTGVDVTKDRIVELALILQDFDTRADRLRYVVRLNPEMRINPKALAVHGIASADLVGCKTFVQVAPLVVKIIDKVDLIVGHNLLKFDLPLLINELLRVGVMFTKSPMLFDTMVEGRGCTPDGKFPTLGELCYSLDVDYDSSPGAAHAADYDVDVTLRAFHRGIRLGIFKMPEPTE